MLVQGKPKKLKEYEKTRLISRVKEYISNSEKLSKTINRYSIRAGRIYLYHLVEQFGWDNPNSKFIKPLIDGKYAEFPYARISIYNNKCTLGWQRHNEQWAELFEGTLEECFAFIDEQNQWFH
jgi:hypothetical protein